MVSRVACYQRGPRFKSRQGCEFINFCLKRKFKKWPQNCNKQVSALNYIQLFHFFHFALSPFPPPPPVRILFCFLFEFFCWMYLLNLSILNRFLLPHINFLCPGETFQHQLLQKGRGHSIGLNIVGDPLEQAPLLFFLNFYWHLYDPLDMIPRFPPPLIFCMHQTKLCHRDLKKSVHFQNDKLCWKYS